MSVVAEGMKNAQVVDMLRRMGADSGQCDHIARPMALQAGLAAGAEARKNST